MCPTLSNAVPSPDRDRFGTGFGQRCGSGRTGYDAVLAELQGSGKLLTRKADAKDLTDQVVDVKSRIASQRASVDRVRKLMDEADQLSDGVPLEGELSFRHAELDSLLAQQTSLRDRTDLATITLNLSEPEKKQPAKEKEEDGPGFLDALGGGWHAFVTVLKWIATVLATVAPFAAASPARRLKGPDERETIWCGPYAGAAPRGRSICGCARMVTEIDVGGQRVRTRDLDTGAGSWTAYDTPVVATGARAPA